MIEGEDGIYSSGEGNGCHRRELRAKLVLS